MALHADQLRLSSEIGGNLRAAQDEGYLTNTNVAAADTVAGVRALMAGGHADQAPNQHRFQRAVDLGSYSSELTDALIAPLTTVQGLLDLTQAGSTQERHQMIQ
ncbi:MAG TPA: hypothetical protein VFS27_06205 [Blastocatellia bacterium]|jgi:hypothetical protein|nr:hypothetical protein [Blastocatellia bacterium]